MPGRALSARAAVGMDVKPQLSAAGEVEHPVLADLPAQEFIDGDVLDSGVDIDVAQRESRTLDHGKKAARIVIAIDIELENDNDLRLVRDRPLHPLPDALFGSFDVDLD